LWRGGEGEEMKEGEKLILIFCVVLSASIATAALIVYTSPYYIEGPYYIKDELPTHDNFTYMPHYVKIHIVPEEAGLTITTKEEGISYTNIWITDDESDVVVEMISIKKYNVNVRGKSYFIYPHESYYTIITE
jgi:hypothetical protein